MAVEVKVVTGTPSATATGTTDFTSSGFGTPTAAIVLGSSDNTAGAALSVGFWDGTNQCLMSVFDDDAATSARNVVVSRTDAIFGFCDYANDTSLEIMCSASAVTDGIRLTTDVDNTTSSIPIIVVLIKGCSAKIESVTPSDSVSGTVATGSLGFAPKLLFATSVNHTATDTANSGSAQTQLGNFSFGAAGADGTHRSIQWRSTDGAANMTYSVMFNTVEVTGALSAVGEDWMVQATTFGSDTVTFTTNDAGSSEKFFALILGGADLYYSIKSYQSTDDDTVNTTVVTSGDVNPVAVIAMQSGAASTDARVTNGQTAGLALGAYDGTTQATVNFTVDQSGGTSNSESLYTSAKFIDLDYGNVGSIDQILDATVSFSSGDVVLDWSVVNADLNYGFLVALGSVGSTPVTIEMGVGAANAAGLTGTVASPITIAAGTGVATALGLAGGVSAATAIQAGVGAASAAGLTGTVSSPITIEFGVGAATAAGLAGNVSGATIIPMGVGAATAAGLAGEVSSPITIAMGVGAATAAGLTGNVASGVTILFGVGAASAAGLTGTVSESVILPMGVGAATAAGLAGTVSEATVIAFGVGAATAAGLTGDVVSSDSIAMGVGAAIAAGLTGGVASPITIAFGVGAATAAGLAGTVENGTVIAMGVGAAAAAGLTGSVDIGDGPIAAGTARSSRLLQPGTLMNR